MSGVVVHGCANGACRAVAPGRRFALTLREVAPGVVEVPTVACAACGGYLFTEPADGAAGCAAGCNPLQSGV